MSRLDKMFVDERPYCTGCATRLAKVICKTVGKYDWKDLPTEGQDYYMEQGIAVLHECLDIADDDEAVHDD